ncbi:hypothetical protein SAMN05421504_107357 [Amycolatopsis xylanica]|uniref:Cellulose biosynthesis protein BcsQ n=1 Tax=Amycolatopsis xylanica TaxID=589385 RepID=A0A1H3NLN1_9PSEU|nr:hypothetical protein [Amycolatopsis xylanica]SDY89663.1 hypothetical protein SAMN05421504_107357 [Amycolatopsis xylanica]
MITTFYARREHPPSAELARRTAAALASWGHRVLCVERSGLPGFLTDPSTPVITARDNGVEVIHGEPERIDLETLYTDRRLGDALEAWRDGHARQYDAVLIDCPHGTSDTAAVCLAQLPDTVVALLGDGSTDAELADILRRADAARDRMSYGLPQLTFVPILPPGATSPALTALADNWLSREVSPAAALTALAFDARQHQPRLLAALLARELDASRLLVQNPRLLVAGARKAELRRERALRARIRDLLTNLTHSAQDWDAVRVLLGTLETGLRLGDWDTLERALTTSTVTHTRHTGPIPAEVAARTVTLLDHL